MTSAREPLVLPIAKTAETRRRQIDRALGALRGGAGR
jgi:hypothetical protein